MVDHHEEPDPDNNKSQSRYPWGASSARGPLCLPSTISALEKKYNAYLPRAAQREVSGWPTGHRLVHHVTCATKLPLYDCNKNAHTDTPSARFTKVNAKVDQPGLPLPCPHPLSHPPSPPASPCPQPLITSPHPCTLPPPSLTPTPTLTRHHRINETQSVSDEAHRRNELHARVQAKDQEKDQVKGQAKGQGNRLR